MDDPTTSARGRHTDWQEELTDTAPVTVTSENGAIEIEMGVDLTVRRVSLQPRATRDLDDLESQLRGVINEAVKAAQEANPINRRLKDTFGANQQDAEEKLAGVQDQMRQRASEVEAYLTDMKRRLEMQRNAMRKRR